MRETEGKKKKRSLNCFLSRSGNDGDFPGYYWPELTRAEFIRKIKGICEALWQEIKGNKTEKKMMLPGARRYTSENKIETFLVSHFAEECQ